jgi:hypothetical protein
MKAKTYLATLPPTHGVSIPLTVVLSLRITKRFSGKRPTVQQLRDAFGMSRATAFRWVAAWDAVYGVAA